MACAMQQKCHQVKIKLVLSTQLNLRQVDSESHILPFEPVSPDDRQKFPTNKAKNRCYEAYNATKLQLIQHFTSDLG